MGKFDIKKLITEELNAALDEELKNSDDFEITSDYVSDVRFIQGGQITEVVFKDPKIAENITMRWSSVSNKLRVISFYDDNTIQLHTEQLVNYALNQLVPKDGNKIIYTRPKENMIEGKNYTSDSVREFIENNDMSSPYKPAIKLFGRDFDSKHLDVEWSVIEELIRILER